jgi:hypothetical protein
MACGGSGDARRHRRWTMIVMAAAAIVWLVRVLMPSGGRRDLEPESPAP